MILLAGASHKTCALPIRERLAALDGRQVLARAKAAGWSEAVVVSTCNRFELYVAADGSVGHPEGARPLAGFLDELAGERLGEQAYHKSGSDAIHHILAVAAGLDSLVLGETEILGQVKESYESAREAGATGKTTNVLFQRALFVGKKVRSDTGIAVGHTSVASVAVDLAERIFGTLKEREVLVLGAGEMAELTSKHLASSKIAKLFVSNRTFERGRELAGRHRGEAVKWEDFPRQLELVDIVIGSTGSDKPVVTREMVEAAMPSRKGRSLFFIDIAMPRDVEAAAHEIDHVYVYTLKDLEGIVAENVAKRRGEFEAAQALVRGKAEELAAWASAQGSGAPAALSHA